MTAIDCPLTTLALALVGAGWLSSYVLSFARMLVDLARPGIPVRAVFPHAIRRTPELDFSFVQRSSPASAPRRELGQVRQAHRRSGESRALTKAAWAVVTGATAGIGRDFALQLAGAGFNVFLASRTKSKLDEIASEISELRRSRKVEQG